MNGLDWSYYKCTCTFPQNSPVAHNQKSLFKISIKHTHKTTFHPHFPLERKRSLFILSLVELVVQNAQIVHDTRMYMYMYMYKTCVQYSVHLFKVSKDVIGLTAMNSANH